METKRIGAKRIAEIPKDILNKLNIGEIETANLVEYLALNQIELLYSIHFPKKLPPEWQFNLSELSVNQKVQQIGIYLFSWAKQESILPEVWAVIHNHKADMVRQWACFWLFAQYQEDISLLLDSILKYAKDPHFAVRESAWISVRPVLSNDIALSIRLLESWVQDADANVRRFAIEVLRPCGVWTKHIPILKKNPEIAAHLLEYVCADTSRYVQNSVANWLNDAGKYNPEWVKDLCTRWANTKEKTPETRYILKRALRNIQL
ncbi:MAG: DNA alkylation repair protein [Bacteroidia bacterium]|nr:DNA alkylation repair protein [Bacteroidia bacterium]